MGFGIGLLPDLLLPPSLLNKERNPPKKHKKQKQKPFRTQANFQKANSKPSYCVQQRIARRSSICDRCYISRRRRRRRRRRRLPSSLPRAPLNVPIHTKYIHTCIQNTYIQSVCTICIYVLKHLYVLNYVHMYCITCLYGICTYTDLFNIILFFSNLLHTSSWIEIYFLVFWFFFLFGFPKGVQTYFLDLGIFIWFFKAFCRLEIFYFNIGGAFLNRYLCVCVCVCVFFFPK
jgi:hypothetical protein